MEHRDDAVAGGLQAAEEDLFAAPAEVRPQLAAAGRRLWVNGARPDDMVELFDDAGGAPVVSVEEQRTVHTAWQASL